MKELASNELFGKVMKFFRQRKKGKRKLDIWEGMTDDMKEKVWQRLEGEWLYLAGKHWKGVTNEMKEEALGRLEGEWLWMAGYWWEGIYDKHQNE